MSSAIGTGKTYMLLLKVWKYCQDYPGTTALVVRKEFTDLKDSTMRDFETYFGVKIGSDKDYRTPEGSKIMFRHANEIDVLKNVNLGIAAIEQAEEFEDDTQFQFIRDRLRQRNGATVRPLCVIANANGHNWVWKLWVQGKPCEEIEGDTGQYKYIDGEYMCITANTFANVVNLPPDFVADCRQKEFDAPSHYRRYVLNSFEETDVADCVFTYQELHKTRERFKVVPDYGMRVAGIDVARYGDDKSAVVILQQQGALHWEVIHVDQWEHKDLSYTTGRILMISNEYNCERVAIDEDGIGGGPLDMLNKGRGLEHFVGFRNPPLSYKDNQFYGNNRTKNVYKLKDMVMKGWISIPFENVIEELTTLKFTFDNHQRRILISKEKMRRDGFKSPNIADAIIMAVSLIGEIRYDQERQYVTRPQYSREDSILGLAGLR